MPHVAFTDRWVRTLKPKGEREDYTDAACEGLTLRVGKRRKTWVARVRVDGTSRRVTLGSYPDVSLAEARRMVTEGTAAELASKRKPGDSVSRAASEPRRGTFRDLVEARVAALEASGNRDARMIAHYLASGPGSALAVIGGDTPAAEVTPDQVTEWLRGVHARGVHPAHPRAMLSAAFSWAMKADYDPTAPAGDVRFNVPANPVAAVGGPRTSGARDRHLSRDELALVWHRFGGKAAGPTVTALILTIIAMGGIRVEEASLARREWLVERDGRTWLEWPRTKNGRPHALPLTARAADLIGWTGRMFPSPFLFCSPHDPEKPLTRTSIPQAVRRWSDAVGMERWQPRDLRRTMKTMINEGWPDLAAWRAMDYWQNHGVREGVAGRHYDRAEYAAVKLRVADAVDELVAGLAAPAVTGQNVKKPPNRAVE